MWIYCIQQQQKVGFQGRCSFQSYRMLLVYFSNFNLLNAEWFWHSKCFLQCPIEVILEIVFNWLRKWTELILRSWNWLLSTIKWGGGGGRLSFAYTSTCICLFVCFTWAFVSSWNRLGLATANRWLVSHPCFLDKQISFISSFISPVLIRLLESLKMCLGSSSACQDLPSHVFA